MSDYSNIINALFTDSKSFFRSYLAFKKDRDQIKKIAFSFKQIPFSGNVIHNQNTDKMKFL